MNTPGPNSDQPKCAAETAAPQIWLRALVVQASRLHMPAFIEHCCPSTSRGER
jgi:hypothetical protein